MANDIEKGRLGATFGSFLEDEGIAEEVRDIALKRAAVERIVHQITPEQRHAIETEICDMIARHGLPSSKDDP